MLVNQTNHIKQAMPRIEMLNLVFVRHRVSMRAKQFIFRFRIRTKRAEILNRKSPIPLTPIYLYRFNKIKM